MILSNIPSAQTLVLSFEAWGIKNIVISPGLRSAPLTLGFTKNSFFTCYSIVDERCAAFFAMGMAQQLQQPLAVVCTSGSAVLNHHPAVAEAFYSKIPLIVISADRPSYRIDIGERQAIRQKRVLENHVGYGAYLKQDITHAAELVAKFGKSLLQDNQQAIQQYNEKEIAKALQLAIDNKTPVHLNIPFEEPLLGTTPTPSVAIPKRNDIPQSPAEIQDVEALQTVWNASPRKMILVGVYEPNAIEKEVLEALAQDDSVLVFTETTANLHHPDFFPEIDSSIIPVEKSEHREACFQQLQPDLLVTFGGLLISKKIRVFLENYPPKMHWHVDLNSAHDTFFCLSKHIKSRPNDFFKAVTQAPPMASDYKGYWRKVKQHCEARRNLYLEQIPFSDFAVFKQLLRNIPEGYQVHLANSTAVRYTQFFRMHPSWTVYCNRGTAGIDGSMSTAIGACIHHPTPTLLITGDLSFFYDSNALWNNYIRDDFRIVLINNGGGGIFKLLPGIEKTKEYTTFFETQHQLTAGHLANMYGFAYQHATNAEQLQQGLQSFYEPSNRPKILEIATPPHINPKVFAEYFTFLSQGL